MARLAKALLALLLPFALASCVLTPGKFVSTLRIDADRHFTFTYVGEVISDDNEHLSQGPGEAVSADGTSESTKRPTPAERAETVRAEDEKGKAIAAALAKEAGYRRVAYLGRHKYSIDYAISGTLDHTFVYPFNIDAEVLVPFLAIELRGNNTVRVSAPGYANGNDKTASVPGMVNKTSQLDGSFTLDTDAEIVSQNNEDGAVTAGARKTVTWKATPTSKDAPTAVLRFR